MKSYSIKKVLCSLLLILTSLVTTQVKTLYSLPFEHTKGVHPVFVSINKPHLSPIFGYALLQIGLKNGISLNEYSRPATATYQLAQMLFPNSNNSDESCVQNPQHIMNWLSPFTLGILLGIIEDIETLSPEIIKEILRVLLSGSFSEQIFSTLPQQFSTRTLSLYREEIVDFYKKFIKTLNTEDDLSVFSSAVKINSSSQKFDDSKEANLVHVLDFFSNAAEDFATLIALSLQECRNGECPANLTQHLLLAHVWQKCEDKADLQIYLLGLLVGLNDENPSRRLLAENLSKIYEDYTNFTFLNFYDFNEYRHLTEDELDLIQSYIPHLDQDENFVLALFHHFGKSVYEGPFPVYIPLGNIQSPDETYIFYTDCIETAMRNMLNIFLYEEESKSFDLNLLTILKNSAARTQGPERLLQFYEHNPYNKIIDEDTRYKWATNTCFNIDGIVYRETGYEVRAHIGVHNIINCLQYFLGMDKTQNLTAEFAEQHPEAVFNQIISYLEQYSLFLRVTNLYIEEDGKKLTYALEFIKNGQHHSLRFSYVHTILPPHGVCYFFNNNNISNSNIHNQVISESLDFLSGVEDDEQTRLQIILLAIYTSTNPTLQSEVLERLNNLNKPNLVNNFLWYLSLVG